MLSDYSTIFTDGANSIRTDELHSDACQSDFSTYFGVQVQLNVTEDNLDITRSVFCGPNALPAVQKTTQKY